ncbi:class I SAM-dependent methyltransferase [Gemmatimonadota bacterium]
MAFSPLLSLLKNHDPRAFLQISGDWKSLLRMHFLHAALESGLLPALLEPRTREELVEGMGVECPELLDGILELGMSLGELALKDGRYRVKGSRSRALQQERNDALAAMVEANVTYYNDVFRGFSRRMRGAPLDRGMESIGPLVARVSKIAEPYLEHFLRKLVKGKGPLRVLDVGCGSGLHLKTALEENRELHGVGLEMDPGVVLQARDNLEGWGIDDRLKIVQGDVRAIPEDAVGPFDLLFLFSVVYYFQVPERISILRDLRERLSPHGRLAVAVSCRGEGADRFSANLNLATTSMEGLTPLPTPQEMEAQLREAGFQTVARERLIPGTTYFGFVAS